MSVAKRDAAKKLLLTTVNGLNKLDSNTPLLDAKEASTLLDKQYADFLRYHEKVLESTGAAQLDFENIEGGTVKIAFIEARALLDTLLQQLQASTGAFSKHSALTSSANINSSGASSSNPTSPIKTTGDSSDISMNASSSNINNSSGGSASFMESVLTAQRLSNENNAQRLSNENNAQRLSNKNNTLLLDNDDIVLRNTQQMLQQACYDAARATAADTPLALASTFSEMLDSLWKAYVKAASGHNAGIGELHFTLTRQYAHAKANWVSIIGEHTQLPNAAPPANAPGQHNGSVNAHKLPAIQIPKFTGNYLSWASFFDLFTSLVHSNNNLTDVQKMHYLQTCVEGEAANQIRAYQITGANYLAAWTALQERYNNRRLIANAHMVQLLKARKVDSGSASSLRQALDANIKGVRALTALNQPTEHWDLVLTNILVEQLDTESKRDWEMSLLNDNMPTFNELCAFLERRCRSLDAVGQSSSKVQQRSTTTGDARKNGRVSTTTPVKPRSFVATNSTGCAVCQSDHNLWACPTFQSMNTGIRFKRVKELGLCFNCLRSNHRTAECGSRDVCHKCSKRHHTMLHYDEGPDNKAAGENAVVANTSIMRKPSYVLLATAVAQIMGNNGAHHPVRILLDSGSQTSFATEACVCRVGVTRTKASIPVAGLGQEVVSHTRGMVGLTIQPTGTGRPAFFVQAFVLQHITQTLPSMPINKANIPFLARVPLLADPTFDTPGDIDILLGADVLGALMLDEKLYAWFNKALFAQNTLLGWVVSGPIPDNAACGLHTTVSLSSQLALERALERFWELEEVGPANAQTPEELACEQHFATTHRRSADGRYCVELPFREDAPQLGDSYTSAMRSLHSLERRFLRQPELLPQYSKFMDEYIALGHMVLVTHNMDDHSSFYLPHHPVFKSESTSTKMRVVFDASRKTSTGISLNDTLMVGPKLQQNLVDILLRFRSHHVAFCGDLVKMYRQIRTTTESSEFQRILWRPDTQHAVQTYRLDTVTYGTASASYLATKALQQLANDEAHRYPLASKVTLTDFYVDDLMTGCDTIEEAAVLQSQLIELTNAGGFKLSKWASNTNEILENVPVDQREINCPLEIHSEDSIKTLGLAWNPSADCFLYRVKLPHAHATTTKRIVLSEVSSLYDPLQLLAPLIIAAKIFIQTLWAEGVTWDEPLPPRLAQRYIEYRNDLSAIHALNIPRWLGIRKSHSHQLHGFCDASEAAYAAVVYLRSTDPTGSVMVRIITARTKVAPVKKISLPRLELCGAVLLAKLLAHVKSALQQEDIEEYAWCDSTVTLAWIRKPSHTWHTFVANRVSAIQSRTTSDIWSHIPGSENPADAASRGLTASALVEDENWWNGPSWLVQPIEFWPKPQAECDTTLEAKPVINNHHLVTDSLGFIDQFSSLCRLQRVSAYVLRFWFNLTHRKPERRCGPLTTSELLDATNRWVRATQAAHFPAEIAACKAGQTVANKSVLKTLSPLLDEDSLLRVGGRLGNAHISFAARHPAILPKNSHLANLLVANAHHCSLHGGPQLTIATLRQRYWIISVRSLAKQYIRRCPVCIRHGKTHGQQMMAPLPTRRTQQSRAFLTSGVDYAGPFTIKLQPGRGSKTTKAYIALFVCFSTKALHLELVSSLTTDAFLAAFRRFVARRGKCAHLYSDCGTNFVGACKELRRLQQDVIRQFNDDMLADRLTVDETQWHFNPPGAPNFGGIWEAGVKSVKHHLRRVLGTTLLTFEELATTLAQIEAILNSRPICPMSDDVDDPQALTPGHFLIGEPMTSVPDPIVETPIPPMARWRHLQQITQHFWNRWRREYITTLQQRYKWTKNGNNLQVGSLALIIDENLPPAKWSLGRVVELHPGSDGAVRVVTIKHKLGIMKRPVVKLCPLPYLDNLNDGANGNQVEIE